jgi:hypothetical protein
MVWTKTILCTDHPYQYILYNELIPPKSKEIAVYVYLVRPEEKTFVSTINPVRD